MKSTILKIQVAGLALAAWLLMPSHAQAADPSKHGFIFNLIDKIGSKVGGKAWDFMSSTETRRDKRQEIIDDGINNTENSSAKNEKSKEQDYSSNVGKDFKEGGEAAHDGVGKGYKAVGDAVMPGVTKVAGQVVDKADDINKKVEKAQSLFDRLFGRGSKPKDVDKTLEDERNAWKEWESIKDDSDSKGSSTMETIRQTDIGKNGVEATGGGHNEPPPPPPPTPAHTGGGGGGSGGGGMPWCPANM